MFLFFVIVSSVSRWPTRRSIFFSLIAVSLLVQSVSAIFIFGTMADPSGCMSLSYGKNNLEKNGPWFVLTGKDLNLGSIPCVLLLENQLSNQIPLIPRRCIFHYSRL